MRTASCCYETTAHAQYDIIKTFLASFFVTLARFCTLQDTCKNFKILALCARIVAVLAGMYKSFFLQECLARKVQDLVQSCKEVLPGHVVNKKLVLLDSCKD